MNRKPFVLLPAALLGAVAFALTLIITDPPGPGLDPDALAYMGAAESVARHGEFRIPTAKWNSADSTAPLAHFPPGYSAVLAIPVRLGMTPPQAARLVDGTAAFVSVCTLVLLVGSATSVVAGGLLPVALFAMASMHEVHVSVLSEPLFLACVMLTLAAMVWWPEHPLRAGLPAAVGVMTRYAGAALVGAVAVWMLTRPGAWSTRVRRATIAVLPAVVLQGAWVVRTRALAGPGEIRQFALYGDLGPTLLQGRETIIAWLVPDANAGHDPIPHRGAIAIAAALALATLVAMGVFWTWIEVRHDGEAPRKSSASVAWPLMIASALIIVCYLGVVGASRVLADPDIPLDQRILAPVLLLLTTIAATAIAVWWRRTHLMIARIAVAGALLGWWLSAAETTYDDAHYALDWGSDFAGQQWRRSELLDWARTAGAHAPLYANWPAAVYFHLHRPARELPRPDDARAIVAFGDTIRARGARVLMFNVPTKDYVSKDMLRRTSGLRVVATLRDGVVLAP